MIKPVPAAPTRAVTGATRPAQPVPSYLRPGAPGRTQTRMAGPGAGLAKNSLPAVAYTCASNCSAADESHSRFPAPCNIVVAARVSTRTVVTVGFGRAGDCHEHNKLRNYSVEGGVRATTDGYPWVRARRHYDDCAGLSGRVSRAGAHHRSGHAFDFPALPPTARAFS